MVELNAIDWNLELKHRARVLWGESSYTIPQDYLDPYDWGEVLAKKDGNDVIRSMIFLKILVVHVLNVLNDAAVRIVMWCQLMMSLQMAFPVVLLSHENPFSSGFSGWIRLANIHNIHMNYSSFITEPIYKIAGCWYLLGRVSVNVCSLSHLLRVLW